MSYQSPIDLIMSDMQVKMEGEILKAVQNVGVNVDKEELLKALKYDRNQYQKGYADRDTEIIRCKDCKHWYFADNRIPSEQENVCGRNGIVVTPSWYCADGERR